MIRVSESWLLETHVKNSGYAIVSVLCDRVAIHTLNLFYYVCGNVYVLLQ